MEEEGGQEDTEHEKRGDNAEIENCQMRSTIIGSITKEPPDCQDHITNRAD